MPNPAKGAKEGLLQWKSAPHAAGGVASITSYCATSPAVETASRGVLTTQETWNTMRGIAVEFIPGKKRDIFDFSYGDACFVVGTTEQERGGRTPKEGSLWSFDGRR